LAAATWFVRSRLAYLTSSWEEVVPRANAYQ